MVRAKSFPYAILRNKKEFFTIILASLELSFFLSRSIYLPALNPLAKDLNSTASTINTSITVYIVFRGIAPTFIGSISDKNGLRPAFMIRYVTYLGANIGLVAEQLLGVASPSLLASFWSLPQLYCPGQHVND
jgi:MFS family permease